MDISAMYKDTKEIEAIIARGNVKGIIYGISFTKEPKTEPAHIFVKYCVFPKGWDWQFRLSEPGDFNQK